MKEVNWEMINNFRDTFYYIFNFLEKRFFIKKIELIKPSLSYEQEVMDFKEEIRQANDTDAFAGCTCLEVCDSFNEWIAFLDCLSDEKISFKDKVPSTTYLAVTPKKRVIGIIDLRHHIHHPILSTWGGHIGYTVRPSERGKGYGKEMLRLNLIHAYEMNIPEVLVTCHANNLASEKVILANGGVFEKEIEVDGEKIKRYWIKTEPFY